MSGLSRFSAITLFTILTATSSALGQTITAPFSGSGNNGAAARAPTIHRVDSTLTLTNGVDLWSAEGQATMTNVAGPYGGSISGRFTTKYTAEGDLPFSIKHSGTIVGTISRPRCCVGDIVDVSVTITGGTGGNHSTWRGAFSLTGRYDYAQIALSGPGWVTMGSGVDLGANTAPAITDVQDVGSYTETIAQGSAFVVKGTNLSGSGYTPFAFPLPTKANDVEITFTPAAGGTGTDAYLLYTVSLDGVSELAAILPSTLPAGDYNVTVQYGDAVSNPFAATVAPSKPELLTQDQSGSGLAAAQNITATGYDLNRFTTGAVAGATISPAKPGQTLVAYATGLGPAPGGDNIPSAGYDFTRNGVDVQAIVGGVSIPALYAGRTPTLAGLDQIDFTLPSNVPTGCIVPLQISVNGTLSAATFISVAPSSGANACVQPGFTTAQLQDLDQGGAYTAGGFSLLQLLQTAPGAGTVKSDSLSGSFTPFTGFQLAAALQFNASTPPAGACAVFPIGAVAGGNVIGLDAGTIRLNGPAGSNIANWALKEDPSTNAYSAALGVDGVDISGLTNSTLTAGEYTLTGAGGSDVGSFSTSTTLGTPVTVSLPSTVTRSAGLTLNWTGGNPSDLVRITGYSGAIGFICTAAAGAGSFAVPASVLMQLPAVSASAIPDPTGSGFLAVSSGPAPATFSPALTSGGNISSTFSALIGTGASATYR